MVPNKSRAKVVRPTLSCGMWVVISDSLDQSANRKQLSSNFWKLSATESSCDLQHSTANNFHTWGLHWLQLATIAIVPMELPVSNDRTRARKGRTRANYRCACFSLTILLPVSLEALVICALMRDPLVSRVLPTTWLFESCDGTGIWKAISSRVAQGKFVRFTTISKLSSPQCVALHESVPYWYSWLNSTCC